MENVNNFIFDLQGKLVFDPVNLTKKHDKQSDWKKIAIVFIDNIDFCLYYSWFIRKRYNLDLQMPLRGLHFTVINDRISTIEKYKYTKSKFNNTIIKLKYSINPKTDDYHWWLDVESNDAEMVRKTAGLDSKPYWGFHLTIGRSDGGLRMEHNKYIYNLIKKFGGNYL